MIIKWEDIECVHGRWGFVKGRINGITLYTIRWQRTDPEAERTSYTLESELMNTRALGYNNRPEPLDR